MKENKMALERLKKVLLQDKMENFEGISRVLRGDLYSLLSCYFDLYNEDIRLNISIDEEGEYLISISATAQKIIGPKIVM